MTLRGLHFCVTTRVFGSALSPYHSLQAALQTGPDAGSTKGTIAGGTVSVADHQLSRISVCIMCWHKHEMLLGSVAPKLFPR